jgi:hypothetical protein
MPRRRSLTPPRNPGPAATQLDAQAGRLGRLARDPTLVPGIYNYCDRWCERCAFTGRCLTFRLEEAHRRKRAAHRGGGAASWDDVSRSLALALRLLDLEALKTGAAAREERRRTRLAAWRGRTLHRAAASYAKAASSLLERLPVELRAVEGALNTALRIGMGRPRMVASQIRDALEVVAWYEAFIEAKLRRASAAQVDIESAGDAGFSRDADGSAKMALIAMDRSIVAWARLREHLPKHADAMLDLLVMLERLRRAAEREFPRARDFRRPGFDG